MDIRLFAYKIAAMTDSWDQYGDYLSLDHILSSQHLRSAQAGAPAHDEMLFIIYHQVCELWFKQILFEMDDVCARLARPVVDDRDMQPVLARLDRVVDIIKLVGNQFDLLETMTPQSFTDVREHLSTASGFQSLQFRLIETRLGLRRSDRIPVFHGQFDDPLSTASKTAIKGAEGTATLFDLLDAWLCRTPFTNWGDYDFQTAFKAAIHAMLDAKAADAKKLPVQAQEAELAAIKRGREKFEGIFDPARHAQAQARGMWRLSLKALQAALFITLYRHEPVLQSPHALLSHIMDIEEQLTLWRVRHALMVQRMVGAGAGTGGSSGVEYLMATAQRHRIFSDLFAMSSYLIPTRALPPLPENVSREMAYRYSA